MNNFSSLFIGILFCIAFSFTGIVISSQIQYGKLTPVAMDEGEPTYPRPPVGIAEQGKQVYLSMGCIYCHSQQVRRKGFGADFERGWGNRQTVARDYIFQNRVVLGTMRTGPDLMNVGERLTDASWHYLHLYDPKLTVPTSIMPQFKFLFEVRKIGDAPAPDALRFPAGYEGAPAEGYEIVPTDRCNLLVHYLLSLKLNYELPEARFSE